MAFLQGYKILLFTGIVFVTLPHFNLGLLSDYKICGDSECESLVSRVQAVRDHRGKDCRFLSFRHGDTIFVYHKLTGKREDLWAGTIDRKFGYFPKDAVQEEQVYATTEKVVKTQKSDFICMDENGYPIDSSHLDNDDDGDNDQEIQNQESESNQTIIHPDETSVESPSASADLPTESPVSTQQPDGSSADEDENKNAGDADARTHKEAHETPAAMSEQGGSPSSSWLDSSVTGWLGLGKEEEPVNLVEEEKNDERKEAQAEASLTSSVTGWLGFGGEGKPDDTVNNREEDKETAASFTSAMTGWLGFGGEKTTDSTKKDDKREMDDESELKETFRSRRISLDLEGSLLQEEEKEMRTLDWLGNGLSSTLGFGVTNQMSETIVEEKEKPASSSWLDMGVGDILGFRKYMSESDESTGSGFEETEKDTTLEQVTGSENVDTSQSQPAPAEEEKPEADIQTLEEKVGMETIPELEDISISNSSNKDTNKPVAKEQDQVPKSEKEAESAILAPEEDTKNMGASDSSEDSILPVDATTRVDQKDISPQTKLEEKLQMTDEERSAETVSEGHQIPKSIRNEGEDNNREPRAKDIKTVSDADQYFVAQSDINLGSDLYSVDSNSMGQSVANADEGSKDQMQSETAKSVDEDGAKITNHVDNTEESTLVSVEIGANNDELEKSNAETDVLHREIFTTQMDESAEQSKVGGNAEESSGKSKSSLSSDTAKERNEPTQSEIDHVKTDADNLDTLATTDDNTETETHHGELVQNGEAHPVESSSQEFGSSHSTNRSTQSLYENSAKDETLTQDTNMDNTVQDSVSLETETEEEKDLKEEMKQEELKDEEEIKEWERQQKVEEGTQEVDEIKEEEKQEEVDELNKREKQEDVKMLKEEEEHDMMEEVKEEQKQEEMKELKKEEKVDGLKGEERQEGLDEVKKVENKEGVEELKEEKHDEVEELTEEEKGEEVEETKEEEKTEELQEDKKQVKVEEFKEEKKLGEVDELKEVQKQEVQKLKEVEKQELKEVNGLKEKENEDGEEKQAQLPHLETHDTHGIGESESNEKETHDENAKTDETHAEEEKSEEEKDNAKQENVEEVKEEKKEVEEMQQVNDMEDEKRDKEEEESFKCSNENCPQATEDESVRDKNENISEGGPSSAEEVMGGNQNNQILADRTGESQTTPSESVERETVGEEEREKTSNDATNKNIISNPAGNEDIYNNNANGISDHHGLEVEQVGATKYTEINLQLASENGHSGRPSEMVLDQTPENTDTDHLVKHTDPSDQGMLCHGHKLEHTDMKCAGKTSSNLISTDKTHSGHKIESLPSTSDSDSHVEQTVPHVSPDPVGSSADHTRGTVENESSGAFGLFKNTISFFSQKSVTKSKDPANSALGWDTSTGETSQPQASLTPEQELDSTSDSSQVSVQDVHKDSPVTTQQHTQPPSPQINSHLHTPSPNAETSFQTKTFSKHYKNLLGHVSVDDITILMELFGRHKLQFLDFILGSSETVTEDPDNDESILSDIERLLHHHRETLVAPNMRLADAPQEDKEKTRTLIALQKLEMLLGRLKEAFNTRKSDVNKANLQAEASCVGASCSTHREDKEESRKTQDSSVAQDTTTTQRDEWMVMEKDSGQLGGVIGKARKTEDEKREQKGIEEESQSRPHIQPGSPQPLEGIMKQILDFIHQIAEDSITHAHAVRELLIWITVQVVSSLPDDIRPGPDLYGVPWEPVIISSMVGLVTMLLFTCRCYNSVKSRMYRSKERWMAEQVTQLLDEKCKVLETLSKCQQEYDDLEDSLKDSGVLAQTQKTEQLEIKARQLEHAKRELERDLGQLKDQLDQQREQRIEQENRIAVLEESMKTLEEETKELQSHEEQAQTTVKVYSMNSDRLQRNLETAVEENTLLQESNAQLRQQAEGWAERVSELEAEMRRCEVTYSGMQQDVSNKDERIMSLTDCLLRMKAWDSDLEEEEGEEGGKKDKSNGTAGKGEENERGHITDTEGHLQKVQKLIYAAKLNADLKSLDEDKDRAFAKLNDEVKAKEDLQESIKELENEKLSLQSDAEHYSDQVQRLQQKLQIMTEMYQENELKLHRLLTVEERERLQKEEKLNKADKNIALAIEEVNNYRQRAGEMEDELEKTKQSYQTQISAHEKKAHNNWLAARAAERELADIRRENALLRQKLTDTQFKLDAIDKDPYALDSLARPLPFRAERSPYGPSPLGRPASETRAFLSPPPLMDGPPTRLSPRVSRGPVEPPGGQGELERSAGPHSDSGSNSPTWERDRRGPPPGPLGPPGPIGPAGYLFPEPGGPIYRRPPPPPGAMGILPPPGSLPPGPLLPHSRSFTSAAPPGPPHPMDMADGTYRENSLGPGEQEHRESGPGDRRTPPEADPRMGCPVGPMDGPFPRRAPYGPPPPDFYPPRGPGGPPMRPMWAPPPPGMMFPPRFPPSGPPLPPAPRPQYVPPMRPRPPDGLPPPSMGPPPPQQSLPSPPHSQSPEEHLKTPEDAI